jgi:hypothetical protein
MEMQVWMGIEVGTSMEKDHRETSTVGVPMTRKIKVRTRDDIKPGFIQIRTMSTAKICVDIILTEDQIYGIVEALKNGTVPRYEEAPEQKWREL